jgi:hypothetical protein
MSKLEDLQPNASVQGILPNCLVTVVSAQWFGSEALELTYKDPGGKVANELLYRHDEPRIDVAAQGRPWSFDGDGSLFRLVSEAHRIRLAHLFDPVLAVHTSVVEPLPHQITAVYESMLPRIADEVISHLSGLVGSSVKVTLEIEATVEAGAPENVVRTVTENSRTLKFTTHGFEEE